MWEIRDIMQKLRGIIIQCIIIKNISLSTGLTKSSRIKEDCVLQRCYEFISSGSPRAGIPVKSNKKSSWTTQRFPLWTVSSLENIMADAIIFGVSVPSTTEWEPSKHSDRRYHDPASTLPPHGRATTVPWRDQPGLWRGRPPGHHAYDFASTVPSHGRATPSP